MEFINGFSKLNKEQKISWLASHFDHDGHQEIEQMKNFWLENPEDQKLFDEFSENTLSNFILPYGLSPNFLINDRVYSIPMVIEESSVVAAASKAAKFWSQRGGFHAEIKSTTKVGHVHFFWCGESTKLVKFFNSVKSNILFGLEELAQNMNKRGGGILSMELVDKTSALENYYQIEMKFETCDAMGANFINSILERAALLLKDQAKRWVLFDKFEKEIDVNMCILSNYTPECLVHVSASCFLEELGNVNGMDGKKFAHRFVDSINIARHDTFRAVTHNKGIFNGIDAVVLATGNDFRATAACGHAYAARDGQYRSLSKASIVNNVFTFSMDIPLALGTVGGLTKLHPMANKSLKILGNPDAKELMKIVACVGLAQNFGAIQSLVTTGIQKGHMKMHLLNILKQFDCNGEEIAEAKDYFEDKVVSYNAVRNFVQGIRIKH